MRHIMRVIGGGAALGTAFYLAPTLGRVLGAVALTGAGLRLLGGRRLAARRAAWRGAALGHGGPLPIDNRWQPFSAPAAGLARQIPLA